MNVARIKFPFSNINKVSFEVRGPPDQEINEQKIETHSRALKNNQHRRNYNIYQIQNVVHVQNIHSRIKKKFCNDIRRLLNVDIINNDLIYELYNECVKLELLTPLFKYEVDDLNFIDNLLDRIDLIINAFQILIITKPEIVCEIKQKHLEKFLK